MDQLSFHAKHHVFRAIHGTGLYHALKAYNNSRNKRLTIVTYHRVTNQNIGDIKNSLNNLFVHVNTFEKQMLFFKKNYRIIGFNELCGLVDTDKVSKDTLLVTFDDGYMDFYQHAYPILRKHNIPVTLFIVPGKIGMEGEGAFWWDDMFYLMNRLKSREARGMSCRMSEDIQNLFTLFNSDMKSMFDKVMDTCSDSQIDVLLEKIRVITGIDANNVTHRNPMLSWSQIRDMSDLVQIGSHTMRHRNMKYLSDSELEEEVSGSKREIEGNIQKKVVVFSYPNGYHNPEIVRHVQNAGYRFAVTTEKGVNDGSNPFLMKRVNLWERTSSVLPGRFLKGKLGLKLIGI